MRAVPTKSRVCVCLCVCFQIRQTKVSRIRLAFGYLLLVWDSKQVGSFRDTMDFLPARVGSHTFHVQFSVRRKTTRGEIDSKLYTNIIEFSVCAASGNVEIEIGVVRVQQQHIK